MQCFLRPWKAFFKSKAHLSCQMNLIGVWRSQLAISEVTKTPHLTLPDFVFLNYVIRDCLIISKRNLVWISEPPWKDFERRKSWSGTERFFSGCFKTTNQLNTASRVHRCGESALNSSTWLSLFWRRYAKIQKLHVHDVMEKNESMWDLRLMFKDRTVGISCLIEWFIFPRIVIWKDHFDNMEF